MHKPNLKCEYSINSRLYTHGDLCLKGVAIAEALQVLIWDQNLATQRLATPHKLTCLTRSINDLCRNSHLSKLH